MSTKNNPGAFRCYEAALPDEPFFTILARDPAGPATLRFWADARKQLGKVDSPDDLDRIADARRDAGEMERWRTANLDPFGDGPTWRGVRIDEMGNPIRIEPDNTVYVYAERDGDEAVRLSIEWLQRQTDALVKGDISREMFAEHIGHACRSPDRRRDRVVPVEEAAADAAKRDERTVAMMAGITSAIGMLDDLGALPGYALNVNRIRQALFNALDFAPFVRQQLPHLPINAAKEKLVERREIADGMRQQTGGPVSSINGVPTGERVLVDTAPSDLAHGPEVPPHRFSVFHKGKRYAYARGLEINPAHLPVALDAMADDGWNLLAIFGQTDSKHVGFIFERVSDSPNYRTFGTEMIWPSEGGVASDKSDRFLAGEPLASIRAAEDCGGQPCGPDGMGRGLEP